MQNEIYPFLEFSKLTFTLVPDNAYNNFMIDLTKIYELVQHWAEKQGVIRGSVIKVTFTWLQKALIESSQ